jgi:hypothetical protein
MPSVTFYPAVAADNGYANNVGEYFSGGYNASYLEAGRYSTNNDRVWLRFALADIPPGAPITSAILRFRAYSSLSAVSAVARIAAVAADNPAAPASATACMALATGAAYVDWTMPAMAGGSIYDSPDVAAVVQEFVNRSGFAPGAHLLMLLTGGAGSAGAYRTFSALGYSGGTQRPELHVTWEQLSPFALTAAFPPPTVPTIFPVFLSPASLPAPASEGVSQAPSSGLTVSMPTPSQSLGTIVPALAMHCAMPRPTARWALPADQMPAAQTIYTLTLTGAADGLADVVIPMASFQSRLQEDGVHYLSAVVPNSRQWAGPISARPHGQWVVKKGYRHQDGAVSLAEIVRVGFSALAWDRGSSGDAATIYGQSTVPVVASKSVAVTGIQYEALDTTGKRRLRCEVSLFLAPGDRCVYPGGAFVVGEIVHYVGPDMAFMEVMES